MLTSEPENRTRMNLLTNFSRAYVADLAIPPAPTTRDVVFIDMTFRGDKLLVRHTVIPIQSVFSPLLISSVHLLDMDRCDRLPKGSDVASSEA
jgi:hypothetical protein